jgi:glutamate:GABA antiporter
LRDVTLLAVACMVGTRWIPAAAHAGPGSVTLWLAAALLFAAPLASAVGALAVKYPGAAGGLYAWTREDFGPWHGFLCFLGLLDRHRLPVAHRRALLYGRRLLRARA